MSKKESGKNNTVFPQLDNELIEFDNQKTPHIDPDKAQGAQGGFVPATPTGYSPRGSHAATGVAGQYSRNSATYQSRKGMSGGKKALVALLVVAIVGILAGGGVYAFAQMKMAEINNDLHDMDVEELEAVDAQVTGKATITEPFTVLLLGSDAREDDPDMGARTDTIILTRIDPLENKVAMVSIPRDTMVEIDGVGTTKINAAYSYGGPSGAIAAVKDLTGVEIDHYAEVNFEGLVALVDAIGGIDVFVDEEIDDPDVWFHVDQGQQHLDGPHALALARSRAYADGDYTRQVNQRKVILAIIDKVLNAPASDLTGLVGASVKCVSTDSGIDVDYILELAQQMRANSNDGKKLTINSATIPSRPAYINEVSYVVADKAGVAELMKVFEACGDVSQPIKASSIDEDIAAAGGTMTNSQGTSIYEEYAYYYEEPAATNDTTYEQPAAPVADTPADTGGGGAASEPVAVEPTEPAEPAVVEEVDDYVDAGDTGGGDTGGGDAAVDASAAGGEGE